MDPFTAFSLIGTLFQFVDCGTRFVLLARSLYQTGSDTTTDYDCRMKIAKDLELILLKFKNSSADEQDEGLAQLAVQCSEIAARWSCVLEKIKTKPGARKRDAMRAAFRLIYKKDAINSLQDQLSSFRNQMSFHILCSLRSADLPIEICSL